MDSVIVKACVVKLMAAFPNQRLEQGNLEVFTQHLARLDDEQILADTVDSLIATETWFPTVARIVECYRTIAAARRPLALNAPDFGPELTAEQLVANRKRLAELMQVAGLRTP